MNLYITIDGDNIGNMLTSSYLENDEKRLNSINNRLVNILTEISDYLSKKNFDIIFFAADGIVAKGIDIEIDLFSSYIKQIGYPDITFSAGISYSLRESFIALKYAKSNGKNRTIVFVDNSFIEK